jgi:diketogulonate reductase-like aldo/keto reductase
MTIPKLELLLRDARVRPAVNQMELHPHFQQMGSPPTRPTRCSRCAN